MINNVSSLYVHFDKAYYLEVLQLVQDSISHLQLLLDELVEVEALLVSEGQVQGVSAEQLQV